MRIKKLYEYLSAPQPPFAARADEAPVAARYAPDILSYRVPVQWPGANCPVMSYVLWLVGAPIMVVGPTSCVMLDCVSRDGGKRDPKLSALLEPWRPDGVVFDIVRGAALEVLRELPHYLPLVTPDPGWRNYLDLSRTLYWFEDDETHCVVVATRAGGGGVNRWVGCIADPAFVTSALAACELVIAEAEPLMLVTGAPEADAYSVAGWFAKSALRAHGVLARRFADWHVRRASLEDIKGLLYSLGVSSFGMRTFSLTEQGYAEDVVDLVLAGTAAGKLVQLLATDPELVAIDLALASYTCVQGPAAGVRVPAAQFITRIDCQ